MRKNTGKKQQQSACVWMFVMVRDAYLSLCVREGSMGGETEEKRGSARVTTRSRGDAIYCCCTAVQNNKFLIRPATYVRMICTRIIQVALL